MVAAGSKGIGFATARALIDEGCQVSICSRSDENVQAALKQLGPGAIGCPCDVSSLASIESWFQFTNQNFGHADILVTNTGGPPAGPLSQMTDEQWAAGFESTLLNIVRMSRIAEESMAKKKWGRIVHVTSIVAKHPNNLLPISTTLRSGIMGLVRLQSNALGPLGITVNCVLPGHTLTERQVHLAQIRSDREDITVEEALEKQGEEAPVGRLGKPEEIASAIAFLCSEQAAYITGTNLLVDGGVTQGIA